MTYKAWIVFMLCIVLSGCGGSDKPQSLSKDAWKQVSCLPQKPGQYCWLEGHAAEVKAIAFSADGKLLASAAYNGVVKLWDLNKVENLYSFTVPGEATCSYENYSRDCTPLFFSERKLVFTVIDAIRTEDYPENPSDPNSRRVTWVGYIQYPIYFWDIEQRKIVGEIKDCYTRSYRFAISADGKYIASECYNRELGKPKEYPDGKKLVTNICYLPNAQALSPESDKFLVVWDITTRKPLRKFWAGLCGRREYDILSLAFRGTEVLAATAGGEVWIWDIVTQKDGDPPMKKIRALGDGVEAIAQVAAFSADAKRVAMSRGYVNSTMVYDLDSGKEIAKLTSLWYQGKGPMVFSPDSRFLASGDNLRVWNVASGELLWESPSHIWFSGEAISFSPEGKFIAISAGSSIALIRFR